MSKFACSPCTLLITCYTVHQGRFDPCQSKFTWHANPSNDNIEDRLPFNNLPTQCVYQNGQRDVAIILEG